MENRALKAGIAVLGLCMLALQIWARDRPSPEQITQQARSITEPAAWRERLAPDFEIPLLDGATFRLSDRVGKGVVILNFFATWCGPCRSEMPELERYYQAHVAEGVLLLGIDAEEKHTAVEAFVREVKVSFPVGIDGDGSLGRRFGVEAYPTTVVIGADGRVKLYETGAIANADVSFGAIVAPAVAEVREGRGITTNDYRAALAAEPPRPPSADADDEDPPLAGRGRQIAAAMPCPCGCDDKVAECGCSVSKEIKARLAKGDFATKTDVEVMQELNKEFCMKPM